MRVRLNGELREVSDGTTIGALIASLGLAAERVAVEVDGDVFGGAEAADRELRPDERVELIQFVGGG